MVNKNTQGWEMKIIKYIDSKHIVVEFQDEYKERVNSKWGYFTKGEIKNPRDTIKGRLGQVKFNKQGSLMKCIEYQNIANIKIKFLDDYGYERQASWKEFKAGSIINPFAPTVQGVGIVGIKYNVSENNIPKKEYTSWASMLKRCFNTKVKNEHYTYKDVTCCKEWLYYPNFYEWLHSQENFDNWLNGDRWELDKDILVKGNKIYSPETCCLAPHNVNSLFVKANRLRGNLPIGVSKYKNNYFALTIYGKRNNKSKTTQYSYPTPEDAFYLGYKPSKEKYIKRVAQEEYDKGNITKKCYEAMMNYQVEITD